MSTFPAFTGNCPRNISKDAKYSVRGAPGRIGLTYCTADDERWHMTTRAHPDLVEMVNDVKMLHGSGPNGPFYINEYKQVIVPVGESATYYFAGVYDQALRFEFEGKTISGEPVDFDGKPLRPGDTWVGPHAGIPYVLTAAGNDVYYRIFPRPDLEKRVKLSAARGRSAAEQIARLLSAFKGSGGGRFYVNEFRSVFSPINGADGLQYIYVGQIDPDAWFRQPLAGPDAAPDFYPIVGGSAGALATRPPAFDAE
jgi:hypothetical protein